MDANKILNGKFTFKQLPNGSIDKTKVICVFCTLEFYFVSPCLPMLFFNQKNICIKQANPLLLIRALKLEKHNGTKINQGKFRIDKNVRLIVI